jgi:glyoxylase-like metal-dependent hydrolase (beta-lactamase superfamily II)
MRELQPGLWHWQAPHPDWTPDERWPQEVSSYAIDDGSRLILFDPQTVPSELLERAAEREPVIVLTQPWHERDTRLLVERLGAPVYTPQADTTDDLVRKFGITPEQAAGGSPDLAWLRSGDRGEAHWFAAGDRLPFGIEAFLGRENNDLQLWIEARRAVILGDTIVDFGGGFGLNEWLKGGVTHEEIKHRLRPLLERPIELVLPTHGEPTDRAALERVLA